jgi:hypothetical protein
MVSPLALIGEARQTFESRRYALAQAIDTARMRSEFAHKTLASEQGLDAAHWSTALTVHGPNLARLLLLPRRFWLAFLPILAVLVDCAELLAVPATPSDTVKKIAALETKLSALEQALLSIQSERRSA